MYIGKPSMKKKVSKFSNFSTVDPSQASSHWLRPDLDAPGSCLCLDNQIIIVLIVKEELQRSLIKTRSNLNVYRAQWGQDSVHLVCVSMAPGNMDLCGDIAVNIIAQILVPLLSLHAGALEERLHLSLVGVGGRVSACHCHSVMVTCRTSQKIFC